MAEKTTEQTATELAATRAELARAKAELAAINEAKRIKRERRQNTRRNERARLREVKAAHPELFRDDTE